MLIRAVAFDIDGTLYPNSAMYRRSLLFALTRPRLLFHFSRVRRRLRHVRPIHHFYELQAEMTAESLDRPKDKVTERIRREIYDASEKVLARVPLFDGVHELLDDLSNRGVRLGVMSDFPVTRKLGILRIRTQWDCCISTEEVGYLKPNPEPFEVLADCLEVPVSETLYVGNSYAYDVVGAARAGMRTAWLNDRGRNIAQPQVADEHGETIRPDFTFSRYAQLREWLLPQLAAGVSP